MQHYGNLRDEEVGESLTQQEALARIDKLIKECQNEYERAKAWFRRLYEEEKWVYLVMGVAGANRPR